MLHDCLAPVAINLSHGPLSEENEIELEAQGGVMFHVSTDYEST